MEDKCKETEGLQQKHYEFNVHRKIKEVNRIKRKHP